MERDLRMTIEIPKDQEEILGFSQSYTVERSRKWKRWRKRNEDSTRVYM